MCFLSFFDGKKPLTNLNFLNKITSRILIKNLKAKTKEILIMSTFDQVKNIIVDSLKCDEAGVTLEANIAEDLGADSLDIVELIMALEDGLGVSIDSEKAKEIVTVGDAVAMIDALK